MTINSAAYANVENTAAIVQYSDSPAPQVVSEADTPVLWSELMAWGMSHTITAYAPPAPPPFSLPVSELWSAMTDVEAEDFDAAMSSASPLRLRRAFNSATSIYSESELFSFTFNVMKGAIGLARAQEIMSAETASTTASAAMEEM